MKNKILLFIGAILTLGFTTNATVISDNNVSNADDISYFDVPYFETKSNVQALYELNFSLTSANQTYGYDITFSDLTRNDLSKPGSIMGFYNGSRSGYLFSKANSSTFQVCVGDAHRDTAFSIDEKPKNTLTAQYSKGTYAISDTLGYANSTGTWTGNYALDGKFRITSCATWSGYSEYVSMKVYGLSIWNGTDSSNKVVKVVPKTCYNSSTGVYSIGYYDELENNGTFHEVANASGSNVTKFTLDKNGGTGGIDAVYGGSNTTFGTFPTVTKISVPTKNDAIFDGYYRTSDDVKVYDKDGNYVLDDATYSANVTLKANWLTNPTGKALGGFRMNGSKKQQMVMFGFTYADYANLNTGDSVGIYLYSSSTSSTPIKTFSTTNISSVKSKEGRFYCKYDCDEEGQTYYAKAFINTGGTMVYSTVLTATGNFDKEYN